MITAKVSRAFKHLGTSMADKAELLTRNSAEMRVRAKRADASRWRKAGLLWPLFTKEP